MASTDWDDCGDYINIPDDYADDTPRRGKHVLYWTTVATKALINLRGERETAFETGGKSKSQLWIDICDIMRSIGYDFTPDKVSKKWHNILITYKKNLAKKNAGLSVNWEFFDDIYELYKNKQMDYLEDNKDYDEYDEDDYDNYDDEPIIVTPPPPLPPQAFTMKKLQQLQTQQQRTSSHQLAQPNKSQQLRPILPKPTPQQIIQSHLPQIVLEPIQRPSSDKSKRPAPESSSANSMFQNNLNNGNSQNDFKKFKYNQQLDYDDQNDIDPMMAAFAGDAHQQPDQSWWTGYFEKKLELEREKMRKEHERHKDNINFQKMTLMLQEKVEKTKVDAINSLTNAINKLAEAKYRH